MWSVIQGKDDIAISGEALGCAIGTSHTTALEDLANFNASGILECNAAAKKGSSCKRYRWLLPHSSGEEVRRSWKQLGWEVPVPI